MSEELELLGKLKTSLGIQGEEKDGELKLCLEEAEEIAVNYCNLSEHPDGLKNTVVRMAVDIYRNEQPGDNMVPLAVKSISEGDTSTSFGTVQVSGYAESVLKDYKNQLNRYRKVCF